MAAENESTRLVQIQEIGKALRTTLEKGIDFRELFEKKDPNLEGSIKFKIFCFSLKQIKFSFKSENEIKIIVKEFLGQDDVVLYRRFFRKYFPNLWYRIPESTLKQVDDLILSLHNSIKSSKSSINEQHIAKIFKIDWAKTETKISFEDFSKALEQEQTNEFKLSNRKLRILFRVFEDESDKAETNIYYFGKSILDGSIKKVRAKQLETKITETIQAANELGLDFRESFESLDDNYDGLLSLLQFSEGLRCIGIETETTEVKTLLETTRFGASDNTKVKYHDFLLSLLTKEEWSYITPAQQKLMQVSIDKLRDVLKDSKLKIDEFFNYFDKDGSGEIDRLEFRNGLRSIGINLSHDETRSLMRVFEKEKSTKIDVEAFRSMLCVPQLHTDFLLELGQIFIMCISKQKQWRKAFEAKDNSLSGMLKFDTFSNILLDIAKPATEAIQKFLNDAVDNNYFGLVEDKDQVNYLKVAHIACETAETNSKDKRMGLWEQQYISNGAEVLKLLTSLYLKYHTNLYSPFELFESLDPLISRKEFKDLLNQFFPGVLTKDALSALLVEFESRSFDPSKWKLPPIEISRFAGLTRKIYESNSLAIFERKDSAFISELKALINKAQQEKGVTYIECFQHFDKDGGGGISLKEMVVGLRELGISADEEQIVAALSPYASSDGTIKYQDFLNAIFLETEDENVQEKLVIVINDIKEVVVKAHNAKGVDFREYFERFDEEMKGEISVDEMVSGLKEMGINHDKTTLDLTLSPFTDEKNMVDYYKFFHSIVPNKWHCSKNPNRVDSILRRLCKLVVDAERNGVALEESFRHFDVNNDGSISRKEFQEGLKKLKLKLGTRDTRQIMRRFELPGTNKIDKEGFVQLIRSFASKEEERAAIVEQIRLLVSSAHTRGIDYRYCFEHFDTNFSGMIDKEEFFQGMSKIGLTLTESQILALLDEYGTSRENKYGLSYRNFLAMIGVEDEASIISKILKKIRMRLAHMYSNKKDNILKRWFTPFDKNNDGTITRTEFLSAIKSIGLKLSDRDMHILLHLLDERVDGILDYMEFIKKVQPNDEVIATQGLVSGFKQLMKTKAIDKEIIRNTFQHFDIEEVGVITKREFRCGLASLGLNPSEVDGDKICNFLDINGDGRIDYLEFIEMVFNFRQSGATEGYKNVSSEILIGRDGRKTASAQVDTLEQELCEFISMAKEMNIPLEETFKYFDRSGDGTITFEELFAAMIELGFQCTKSQLLKIMTRIGTVGKNKSPSAKLTKDDDRICYRKFLSYWTERQNQDIGETGLSQEYINKKVKKLRQELKHFFEGATRRGVTLIEVFQHFDIDGDGKITVKEFEQALNELYLHKSSFEPEVVKEMLKQIDESGDGELDYHEFLGVTKPDDKAKGKKKKQIESWQTVFSSRRLEKKRQESNSVAVSIVDTIIRNAESEILNKGSIWISARKDRQKRLNSGTFIQRNMKAVTNRSYCYRASRSKNNLREKSQTQPSEVSKRENIDEKYCSPKKTNNMNEKIQEAERLHAAEEVATRMIEESTIRAEEFGRQLQQRTLEKNASDYGIEKISSIFYFLDHGKAATFLQSIGLGRFSSRLKSSQNDEMPGLHNTYGISQKIVFPLTDDQSMQNTLGTCSTIVARKVKRELLKLLHGDDFCSQILNEVSFVDQDPEGWTIHQVADFVSKIGGSKNLVIENNLNGADLVLLTVDDALNEIGFENEVLCQILVYRVAYLHYVSKNRATRNIKSKHEVKQNGAQILSSIRFDNLVIPRPSLKPVSKWNVNHVASFVESLDISSSEFTKLSIDGATLLELTDEDLQEELGLSREGDSKLRDRLISAIETIRQPPRISVGTGPYLEAGIDAGLSKSTNGSSELVWLDQNGSNVCISANRNHNILIHIRPGLFRAASIAKKVIDEETQIKTQEMRKSDPEETKIGAEKTTELEKGILLTEKRVYRFLSSCKRAGLPLLETFQQYDKQNEGLISWLDFENALGNLGFAVEVSLLRSVCRKIFDPEENGVIAYEAVIDRASHKAITHKLVFNREFTHKDIALTTNGKLASLIADSYSQTYESKISHVCESEEGVDMIKPMTSVLVRYGGGQTKYQAKILKDNKDGTFSVKYDDGELDDCVPEEWIQLTPTLAKGNQVQAENKNHGYTAAAGLRISEGVHCWSLSIIHSSPTATLQGIRVGVITSEKKGFVGTSFNDSKLGTLQTGDVIQVRVDFDTRLMTIKRTRPNVLNEDGSLKVLGTCAVKLPWRPNQTLPSSSDGSKFKQISSFIFHKIGTFRSFFNKANEVEHFPKGIIPDFVLFKILSQLGLEDMDEVTLNRWIEPYRDKISTENIKYNDLLEEVLRKNQSAGANGGSYSTSFIPAVILSNVGDCIEWKSNDEVSSSKSFMVGDNVSVRYGGGYSWYDGVITAVNGSTRGENSYTVTYDNNESEYNVLPENIRKIVQKKLAKKKPIPCLHMRLFCRVLTYMLPNRVKQKEKKTGTTKLRGKVYSGTGMHIEVPINSDTYMGKSPAATRNARRRGIKVRRKEEDTDSKNLKERGENPIPNTGSSFTNAGQSRLQVLLRRRLNEPHDVNWAKTNRGEHKIFSPLVAKQIGSGNDMVAFLRKHHKQHQIEEDWTYLGQVDYNNMKKLFESDQGIPFNISLPEVNEKESGETDLYHRFCFMAVLGKVDEKGKFSAVDAPVEPVLAVLGDSRFRVGGGYEHDSVDESTKRIASRFFLLTKGIISSSTGCSSEKTKKNVKNKSKGFRGSRSLNTVDTDRHIARSEDDTDLFDADEKIVIDRWLAFHDLDLYGHTSKKVYHHSPIVDPKTGLRKMSRYEYILLLHPTRPWIPFAAENAWLPQHEDEVSKFEEWANNIHSKSNNTFPKESVAKTLYERCLSKYPMKPWLNFRKSEHKGGINENSNPRYSRKTRNTWTRNTIVEGEAQRIRKWQAQNNNGISDRESKQNALRRIDKEIKNTSRSVAKTLKELETQEYEMARVKAQLSFKAEEEKKQNEESVNRKDTFDREKLEKATAQLAEEARARSEAEARLEWEQEQQLKRLKSIQQYEKKLRQREKKLRDREDELREYKKTQKWADRVTKTKQNRKAEPKYAKKSRQSKKTTFRHQTPKASRIRYDDYNDEEAIIGSGLEIRNVNEKERRTENENEDWVRAVEQAGERQNKYYPL